MNVANVRVGVTPLPRDVREVIRDEHIMRPEILRAVDGGPLTIPEIAAAVDRPTGEVVYWVMGMRKYGFLAEVKEPTDDGYYRYRAVRGAGE